MTLKIISLVISANGIDFINTKPIYQIGKPTGIESRLVVVRGSMNSQGEGKMATDGCRISLWGDENVLKLSSGNGCRTL